MLVFLKVCWLEKGFVWHLGDRSCEEIFAPASS